MRTTELLGDTNAIFKGNYDFRNATIRADSITDLTELQLTTGATTGYVLTSDATGVASWSNSASGWKRNSTIISMTLSTDTLSVGSDTPSGTEKMHCNGSVLFDGTGSVPISGAGTRLMWCPTKASLRVGTVNSTQWDNSNVGQGSFATGLNTIASGDYSVAIGNGSKSLLQGQFSQATNFFNVSGDAQYSTLMLMRRTTSVIPLELTLDGISPNVNNRFVLSPSTTYFVNIQLVSRREAVANESYASEFTFVMHRESTLGSVGLIGNYKKVDLGSSILSWDSNVTFDLTNGVLQVMVTGENSKNILWVATVKLTQITG
jgi:hypothetical protein